MYCKNCGRELNEGARFCAACGASQDVKPTVPRQNFSNLDETVRVNNIPPTISAPIPKPKEKKDKSNFGITLAVIISVAVAVMVAIGVLIYFVVLRDNGNNVYVRQDDDRREVVKKDSSSDSEFELSSIVGIPADSSYKIAETETYRVTETEPQTSIIEEEPEEEPMSQVEALIIESDTRLFDYTDIYDLSAEELKIVRNGIYARHGRMFTTEWLQEHFMQYSWYAPLYSPDEFNNYLLNDIERSNVDFIVEFETMMGY